MGCTEIVKAILKLVLVLDHHFNPEISTAGWHHLALPKGVRYPMIYLASRLLEVGCTEIVKAILKIVLVLNHLNPGISTAGWHRLTLSKGVRENGVLTDCLGEN